MDAPDELVEAVAQALADEGYEQDERSDPHAFYDYWPDMARAALSVPALAEVNAAAARLRSLAALFEQPLNRDQEHTFTGHALAEMLRGEG